MGAFDNYECDGQLSITDFLDKQIQNRTVKDLTSWINSQGDAQYNQIGDLVKRANKDFCGGLMDKEMIDLVTNCFSCWVLDQSFGYMNYLRNENK